MLIKLSTILIVILLIGCGRQTHTYSVSVNPNFQIYLKSFIADGKRVGASVSVNDLIMDFGDPNSYGCGLGLNGCCLRAADTTPKVIIDQNYWDSASDTVRTILVYHELGHCLLGREHDDKVTKQNLPKSIMETTMDSYLPQLFEYYKEAYILELFGKGNGPVY